MNIWIVSEGEKKGPFTDYEVRRKISDGEFLADTVGWHDGCAEWMPLSQMAMFEREFETSVVKEFRWEEPPLLPPAVSAAGEGVGSGWTPGVYWVRRFWARWLDLHLFAGLVWIGLYLAGVDIGAVLRNLWIMLFLYAPWVPVEAYLIARFQTTPGKWLAGLRVVKPVGGNPDFRSSMRRALRVYFLGIGMGWGVISLICQIIALFTVRAAGRAVWDREGTYVVEGRPWKKRRGVVLAVIYILATQLQWIVVAPYFMEDFAKRYPEWKQWMEMSPPKHLPRKH